MAGPPTAAVSTAEATIDAAKTGRARFPSHMNHPPQKSGPANRPLNGIEKSALALAAIFIIFGFVLLIHPMPVTVIHPSYHYAPPPPGWVEQVSQERSRFYGGLLCVIGAALARLAAYRPRRT
jgi:hypothetical protein